MRRKGCGGHSGCLRSVGSVETAVPVRYSMRRAKVAMWPLLVSDGGGGLVLGTGRGDFLGARAPDQVEESRGRPQDARFRRPREADVSGPRDRFVEQRAGGVLRQAVGGTLATGGQDVEDGTGVGVDELAAGAQPGIGV